MKPISFIASAVLGCLALALMLAPFIGGLTILFFRGLGGWYQHYFEAVLHFVSGQ